MFDKTRRLKGPIFGGEGDASGGTGGEAGGEKGGGEASATPTPPATPQPTQAEFDAIKDQLKGVGDKNKEMEGMLLDPSYIEYLEKKDSTDKTTQSETLNDMDNAQLMEHMSKTFGAELAKAVGQINGTARVEKAEAEVIKFRGGTADFDLYIPEMVKIAKENPNLSVERVYNIAKKEVGPRTALKAAAGELPGNQPPGEAPPTKGFKEHFDKSWQKSGLEKILKEVS